MIVASASTASGVSWNVSVLANIVFGQVWKRISDAPTPPNATDEDYSTREVLLAAVLQGALFGLIKSAIDRAGMRAMRRAINAPPTV